MTWLNNLKKDKEIKVVRVRMAPAATIHEKKSIVCKKMTEGRMSVKRNKMCKKHNLK